jgi:outer membrane protein assembly factor BamB
LDAKVISLGDGALIGVHRAHSQPHGSLTAGYGKASKGLLTVTYRCITTRFEGNGGLVSRTRKSAAAGGRAPLAIVGVVAIICGTIAAASPASAATYVNWPSYLDGPTHNSYLAGATAITPSNASTVASAWNFMPAAPPVAALGHQINASPTVENGVVYIGANSGIFYALDETTGAVLWRANLGYVTSTGTCGTRGITATATVAPDPKTGTLTVYVSGGNGYLYALNATTGAVIWKSVIAVQVGTTPNYYDWSTPTVANNHVYVGIAGQCTDHVRGGLLAFNQSTGKRMASYHTVPSGMVGGSIWSSPAVAGNGNVYAGTGNVIAPTPPNEGTSESIVELNGKTLAQVGVWQLPLSDQASTDDDFGASVSLFSAKLPGTTTKTPMVGTCNKNGVYYALRQGDLAAGPVWQTRIADVNTGDHGMSAACLASTAVQGSHLFVAGTATTIGGIAYGGSITELNAATGKVLWATGLPQQVLGTPALDGAGVLSVATIGSGTGATNADYLLNASTGSVLATLNNGNSPQFAQPVFADGYLFDATDTAGLTAYKLAH